MAKFKNKKAKANAEPAQSPSPDNIDQNSTHPVRAIDGHTTSGWTDDEIKAYNELVIERQKLEQQRQDLEERCAKSQAQRALLHENVANIDSLFKQDSPMSLLHKFQGTGNCCVEHIVETATCGHELCTRAKSEGITDIELDTLKYYSVRIQEEKSVRMINALKKQRDLELIKIRQQEQDALAQNARKNARRSKSALNEMGAQGLKGRDMTKAAKETEKIVNRIIGQLDDLRTDLQNGRISAEDAQGKLNILDGKLPAAQGFPNPQGFKEGIHLVMDDLDIRSNTQMFQSHLRGRLLNSKTDTSSQAFSIMNNFLSATKPDEFQQAVLEFKGILELSGPIGEELHSCLGLLEGIIDKPKKLLFTGPDDKQECNSVIELMEKLKDHLKQTGKVPDDTDPRLGKVLQDCINLEIEANEKMARKCADETITSAVLPVALLKIKNECVSKSPIPLLTSNKLDVDVENLLDVHDTKQLFEKARSGAKTIELEAQITSLIISRTQKRSAKYVERLERLDKACISAGAQDGWAEVRRSIANVSSKMKKRIPASGTRKEVMKSGSTKANGPPITDATPAELSMDTLTRPVVEEALLDRMGVSSDTKPLVTGSLAEQVQQILQASVAQSGKDGLWSTFECYALKTSFECDTPLLDKTQSYTERIRAMIEDQTHGVQAAVCSLYKFKLCPAMAATIVAQALLIIANSSLEDSKIYLQEFSACMSALPSSVPAQWASRFQHIALAMIQLYVAAYVESKAVFPRMPALYLAFSMMETVTKFVLLTRLTQASHDNLRIMMGFWLLCFGKSAASFGDAMVNYENFAVNDDYRCLTAGVCSKHMVFHDMPHEPMPKDVEATSRPLTGANGVQHALNDFTPPASTVIESDMNGFNPTVASEQRIVPMKTRVIYPKDYKPKQVNAAQEDDRDLQTIRWQKRPMEVSESVAQKSYNQLMLEGDDSETRKLADPHNFIVAMDELLDYTKNASNTSVEHSAIAEIDTTLTTSRFAEHLDDQDPPQVPNLESVVHILRVFKKLRRRTFAARYLELLQSDLKSHVLSGSFADPVNAIACYAESVLKLGDMPNSVERVLIRTQDDLQAMLESTDERNAFETRRLRFLLKVVKAQEPNASALFNLAVNKPTEFGEYYDIITDKLDVAGMPLLERLETASLDIIGLVKTASLLESSASLLVLAEFAMDDWSQRSKHSEQCESADTDDGASQAHDMGKLDLPSKETVRSIKSSGLRTIVDSQSEFTSLVEPQAADIAQGEPMTEHEAEQMFKVQFLTLRSRIEKIAKGNGSRDHIGGNTVPSAPGIISSMPVSDVAPDARSFDMIVTTVNENDMDIQSRRPAHGYNQDTKSAGHSRKSSEASDVAASEPAPFRMLTMINHLSALQKNSSDMYETAKEIGGFNEEHGKIMQGVADKLATQVAIYTDFAEWIAQQNGISLPREYSGLDHSEGQLHSNID